MNFQFEGMHSVKSDFFHPGKLRGIVSQAGSIGSVSEIHHPEYGLHKEFFSDMETLPTTKQLVLENPALKSCKECWVEFNTVEDWKFHMVDVHGVKVATMALHGKTTSSNRRCQECWVEFASLKDFIYHMLDVHNKDITRDSKRLSFNKKVSSLLRDYRWNRRNKPALQNQTKRQFCTKCGHCFIDKHEESQCKILLRLMQSCVVVITDISRCQVSAEPYSPTESLSVPTSCDSEENYDFNASGDQQLYDFNASEDQQLYDFNASEDQELTENEAEPLLCDCCGSSFNSLKELETHLSMSLCVHCGTSFNTSKELEQHIASSSCSRSDVLFDNSSELQQHHGKSLCNRCGVSFNYLGELEEHLLTSLCVSVKLELDANAHDFTNDFQNKLLEKKIKVEPLEPENLQEQLQNDFFERELKTEPLELETIQEQTYVNFLEGEIKMKAAEPDTVQEQLQNYPYESEIKQEPLELENMQGQIQNYPYVSEIKEEPLESQNIQVQFVLHSEISIEPENFDEKIQLEAENFNEKMQLNVLPSQIKTEPESEDEDNQLFPQPLQIELDHEMKTKVLEKAIKTEPSDSVEEMQTSSFEHPLRIELEGIQLEMQEEILSKLIKTEPSSTEEQIQTNVDQQSFEEQDPKDQEIQANFLSRSLKIERVSDDDEEEKIEMFHQPLVIDSEKEDKKQDILFTDGHLHEGINFKNKNILYEEKEEDISREPPFKKQCTDMEPNHLISFCFICLNNFINGNEVYRHMLDEHKGSHRCKACHRFLPSVEFFVFHMLCHHRSSCMFCSKGFGSLRPLRLHVIDHVMQVDPDSEWCQFLRPVVEAVKVQSSYYICPFCKAQFPYLIRLVFHCSVHLRETKFSLMVSEFKSAFTSEVSLLSASADNSAEKPLIFILNLNPVHPKKVKKKFRKKIVSYPMCECSECKELFQTEKALIKHICFASKFTCKLCGISCKSSSTLYDHYLEHSKVGETVARNKCNLCRIGFVEKSVLCDHYLEHIHVGDKTCPFCHLGVTDLVMAAKHMKKHFGCGTILKRCMQCERAFFNERNFYQHLCLDSREDFLIKELANLKLKTKKDHSNLPAKNRDVHETVILPEKRKLITFPNDIKSQYIYCVPQAQYSDTNFGRLTVDLKLSNKGEEEAGPLMPSSSLTLGNFSNSNKRKLLPATSEIQVSKNFSLGKQVVLLNAAYPNLIGSPQLAQQYQITHSNTDTLCSSESLAQLPIQPEPLSLPSSLPSFAEPQLHEQEDQLMPQILKVESLSPLASYPSMVAVLPQFSSLPVPYVMKSNISRLPLMLQRK